MHCYLAEKREFNSTQFGRYLGDRSATRCIQLFRRRSVFVSSEQLRMSNGNNRRDAFLEKVFNSAAWFSNEKKSNVSLLLRRAYNSVTTCVSSEIAFCGESKVQCSSHYVASVKWAPWWWRRRCLWCACDRITASWDNNVHYTCIIILSCRPFSPRQLDNKWLPGFIIAAKQ